MPEQKLSHAKLLKNFPRFGNIARFWQLSIPKYSFKRPHSEEDLYKRSRPTGGRLTRRKRCAGVAVDRGSYKRVARPSGLASRRDCLSSLEIATLHRPSFKKENKN
jgi:hypothetical protein